MRISDWSSDVCSSDLKPEGAWSAEQVVDLMIERVIAGDFYILCPDNAVSPALDDARIRWSAEDLAQNRPALSRWHADWKARFEDRSEERREGKESVSRGR